jgi:hypothetical protein
MKMQPALERALSRREAAQGLDTASGRQQHPPSCSDLTKVTSGRIDIRRRSGSFGGELRSSENHPKLAIRRVK